MIVRLDMKILRTFFIVALIFFPALSAWAAVGEDMAGMMRTFQSNLGPVYQLVVAISYVMGVWFIVDSIFRLKKYGQQRTMMSSQASMAKPIILFIIGLGLLYFPTFVNVSIQSIWVNSSSNSVLWWGSTGSTWSAFVNPLIDVVRLFGLIAVVRGLVILTRIAAESTQPGTTGKALMHIIAGTLAINIIGTINIIRATFGF